MANGNGDYNKKLEQILDAAYEKERNSLAGFFIRNYRFTYLILAALLVLGLYSLFTLPREANPEVKIPFAVVTTVFPGGTPTDVEDLVTNKIEDRIKNLDNLRQYTSTSGQGFSSVFVEFEAEADLDESLRKLREEVDNARPELPPEAEDPTVADINITDIPIVTYSLVGEYSDAELKRLADILADDFEEIKNVSKVVTLGGAEREFLVAVKEPKMAAYGLSFGQIVAAIARTNLSLPAGTIDIDEYEYNIRLDSRLLEIQALKDTVIAGFDGAPVYMKDIAVISDQFKERKTASRIGYRDRAPNNTISLQIYKKTGGNILEIVENAEAAIAALFADNTLPAGLIVQKTNDNSTFIKDDLNRLGTSAIQTMVLITLILIVVLSWRGALITALSVPFAFLLTFMALRFEGLTLNTIVLFSLVLSLGLMVDNSIVIIEGVNEYIVRHGKKPLAAAILSVWNYKWPITAGTMTTVGAFLPMLLVSGILGEYIGYIPKTISATLLSSLFVAIVIIPTLVSRILRTKQTSEGGHHARDRRRHKFIFSLISRLQLKYAAFLRRLLPVRAKRRLFLAVVWIVFAAATALPLLGFVEIQMFPKIDFDYFIVNIRLPAGSTLEKTSALTAEAERAVAALPEVDNYVTNLGTSISVGLSEGGSDGTHKANITVNLVPDEERERKSFEIAAAVRPELNKIQGALITVEELSAGPPSGAPIEVRITGEDTKVLARLADEVADYFAGVPGVINVKDSLEDAPGDFTFTVDRAKANYYGLDAAGIASALRSAVFGTPASTVNLAGEDVDITVRLEAAALRDISDLKNLQLTTPRGESIPIKQVAEVGFGPSLLAINHRDGDRIVTVTADLEKGVSLPDVLAGFEEQKSGLDVPLDYSLAVGGELEDIEQSYRETFLSMIVAIILIAFILVLQFNSFRQPFIILFSLPLAIIGVIIGLLVLRLPFSFPAFIGIVSLAGIAVNDAIVLIDKINKNLEVGMDFFEGIIEGGMARMQPIFLTSITTIAGILPLAFSDELWRGLSVAIISGLIFSTFLTLVVVPVYYTSLCRREKCDRRTAG